VLIEKADDEVQLTQALNTFMKYAIYAESSSYTQSNPDSKYVDKFTDFLIQRRKSSLKTLMVLISGFTNKDR
jgi:hypothetical protein